MKKYILIFISLIYMSSADADITDWFKEEKSSAPCPFARFFIEPYCSRIFEEEVYNARTTTYDFMVYPTAGSFGLAYTGIDPKLNVSISLELAENNNWKPIHCTVKKGDTIYYSSDIWMTQINKKKFIYLVSFKESEATLVIYRSKRTAGNAQWALLRERAYIKK